MKQLLKKIITIYCGHRFYSYVILILVALFWHFQAIAPLWENLIHRIDLYIRALQPTMPTLVIEDKKLTMIGDLPKHIMMPDGVDFWFTHEPDSHLIKDSKRYSCVISDSILYIKDKARIYPFPLAGINIDSSRTITGDWLSQKFQSLKWQFYYPLHIASFLLIFLALFLLSCFYAGIALLADAFNDGPFSFSIFFQVSVLLVSFNTAIVFLGATALSLSPFRILLPVIIVTMIGLFLTTIWYIKKKNREAQV